MATSQGSQCLGGFQLLNNQFNQDPCEIARAVVNTCLSDSYGSSNEYRPDVQPYRLYPLNSSDSSNYGRFHYLPPNRAQASPCICSIVTYNLIQACAACQTHQKIESTSWNDFSSNCPATTFDPIVIPQWTSIPSWAYLDSSQGSMDIVLAFKAVRSNLTSSTSTATVLSAATQSNSETTSSQAVVWTNSGSVSYAFTEPALSSSTAAAQGQIPPPGPPPRSSDSFPVYAIVMTVLAALFALAFFVTLGILWRRRSRSRRQGTRLRSSSDLGEYPDTDDARGMMIQKNGSLATTGFLPTTESYLTSSMARSFTTNSVSTGSGFGIGRHHHRIGAFAQSRSTFYTSSLTTSSSSFSVSEHGHDDATEQSGWREDADSELDDSSISPFADLHAPPAAVTTTRDNLHSISSNFSLTAPSTLTRKPSSSIVTDDSFSLLSSTSTRAAPSSTGATYGRAHDSDDDDPVSFTSTR